MADGVEQLASKKLARKWIFDLWLIVWLFAARRLAFSALSVGTTLKGSHISVGAAQRMSQLRSHASVTGYC